MSIVERLTSLKDETNPSEMASEELGRLEEFLTRMRREGVVAAKGYDLPQMDTIGRGLFEAAAKRRRTAAPALISSYRFPLSER